MKKSGFVLIILLMLISSCLALCTDSDNGKSPDISGNVTITNFFKITQTDYCYKNFFGKNTGKLFEYFCENGKMKSEIFFCPYGCEDGTCNNYKTYKENLEKQTEEKGPLNNLGFLKSFFQFLEILPSDSYTTSDSYGCALSGCNDYNSCTTDVCNTDIGECLFRPILDCRYTPDSCLDVNCDDLNECTADSCIVNSGNEAICKHTTIPDWGYNQNLCDGKNCDDNNSCTEDKYFIEVGCTHVPIYCPDGKFCDPSIGECGDTCFPNCLGKVCGSNGCGGSCGICPTGQTCNANGQCVAQCIPKTCTQLEKNCGNWNNECGTIIYCGTCPTGQTCSATGWCGAQCIPKTCTQLGKTCGSWDNTCGTQINCGTCPIGLSCNETGRCVCIPNCINKSCTNDGCGGICPGEKRIFGNKSDIKTGFNITVLVDGKPLDSDCFLGVHEMIFYLENKPLVSFIHDFSAKEFYMNKTSIELNYGFVNVDLEEQLLDFESKTIYMYINTSEVVDLCLKDTKVDSYDDFSNDCTAPDEINLKDCIGKSDYLSGYIQCKDAGDKIILSNLKHSAVKASKKCCSENDCNPVINTNTGVLIIGKFQNPCSKCDMKTHKCVAKKEGEGCMDHMPDYHYDDGGPGFCISGQCKPGVKFWEIWNCGVSNEFPPKQVTFSWAYTATMISDIKYPLKIAECDKDYECFEWQKCIPENGIKKCVDKCDAKICEIANFTTETCGINSYSKFTGCVSKCQGNQQCVDGQCVCPKNSIFLNGNCVPINEYCLTSSNCPGGNICQYMDKIGYCTPGTECDDTQPSARYGMTCEDGRYVPVDNQGCSADTGNCDKDSCMMYNSNTKECYSTCSSDAQCVFNIGAKTPFCLSPSLLCSKCEKYDSILKTCVDNSGPGHKCDEGIIVNLCNGCQKYNAGTCVDACKGDGQVCTTRPDLTKYCGVEDIISKLGYDFYKTFIFLPNQCIMFCSSDCNGKACQDIGCGNICPPQVLESSSCAGDTIIQNQPYCSGGSVAYDTTTLEDCSLQGACYTCVQNQMTGYIPKCVATKPAPAKITTTTREGICGEDFYCKSCEKCNDNKTVCVPNPPCDFDKCEKYNCVETTTPTGITSATRSCAVPLGCNCINKECRNCKKNSDCQGDELCIEGKCEENMCKDETNCPFNMICSLYPPNEDDYGKCTVSECRYDSDCNDIGKDNMICSLNATGLKGVCKDKKCSDNSYCGAGKICKQGPECSLNNECVAVDCTLIPGYYGGPGNFNCPIGTVPTNQPGFGGACSCVECMKNTDCSNGYTCTTNKCLKNTNSPPPGNQQCPLLPNGLSDPNCPNGGCQFCQNNEIEIFNDGAQNSFCADDCNQGDCKKFNYETGQCEYSCNDCETCNSGICIAKCDEKKEDCVMKVDPNDPDKFNYNCEAKPLIKPDLYTIKTTVKNCGIPTVEKTKCIPNCTNSSGGKKPDGADNLCGGYCGECKPEYSCIFDDYGIEHVVYTKKEWVKIINTVSNTPNANAINNEGISSQSPIISLIRSIINFITGKTITGNVINDPDVIAECKVVGDPVYKETCGECETCMPEDECSSCTGSSCNIPEDEDSSETPLSCRADLSLDEFRCGSTSTDISIIGSASQNNPNCPLCNNIHAQERVCMSGMCVSMPVAFCEESDSEDIQGSELPDSNDDVAEIMNSLKLGSLQGDFYTIKQRIDSDKLLKFLGFLPGDPGTVNDKDIRNYLDMVDIWFTSIQYKGKAENFNPIVGNHFLSQLLPKIVEVYEGLKNQNMWSLEMEISYIKAKILLATQYQQIAEGNSFGQIQSIYLLPGKNAEETRDEYINMGIGNYNFLLTYTPVYFDSIRLNELKPMFYLGISNLELLRFFHYLDYDITISSYETECQSGTASSCIKLLGNVKSQENRIRSLNKVFIYQKKALDSSSGDQSKYYRILLLNSKIKVLDSMIYKFDKSILQSDALYSRRFPKEWIDNWLSYFFKENPIVRAGNSGMFGTITAEQAKDNKDFTEDITKRYISGFGVLILILKNNHDLDEYYYPPRGAPVDYNHEITQYLWIRDAVESSLTDDEIKLCYRDGYDYYRNKKNIEIEWKKLYVINCNLEEIKKNTHDLGLLIYNGNTGFPNERFMYNGKEKIVDNNVVKRKPHFYFTDYPYTYETTQEELNIEYQLNKNILSTANDIVMISALTYSGGTAGLFLFTGRVIKGTFMGLSLIRTVTEWNVITTYADYYDPSGTAGELAGIGVMGLQIGRTNFELVKSLKVKRGESGRMQMSKDFSTEQEFNTWRQKMQDAGYSLSQVPNEPSLYKLDNEYFSKRIGQNLVEPTDAIDIISLFKHVREINDAKTREKVGEMIRVAYDVGRDGDCITPAQARGLKYIAQKTKEAIINSLGRANLFLLGDKRTVSIFESDFSRFIAGKKGLAETKVLEIGRTALRVNAPKTTKVELAKIMHKALLKAKERGAEYVIGVTNKVDREVYESLLKRGGEGTVTNVNDVVRLDQNFRASQGPPGPNGQPIGITVVPVLDIKTGRMIDTMKIIIKPGDPVTEEISLEVECNLYNIEKVLAFFEKVIARASCE